MPFRTTLAILFLASGIWAKSASRPPFPVQCLNAGCPEGVGLWVTREPKGVPSQCTAFLISPDRVVTNHHCLPPSAKSAKAGCRDKVRLYFPPLPGKDADSVDCQTIEALSPFEDRIDEPDWALVRLARPVQRRPLPLSYDGFLDLDTVRIWVAAPDWGSVLVHKNASAQIRLQECLVSRRTSVFHDKESKASFLDPRSRRVPLVECPAWKGNSGAPVLRWCSEDSTWKVAGILDRSAPTGSIQEWIKSQELPLLDSGLGDFAYASNLGCLPLNPRPLASSCRQDSSQLARESDRKRWKEQVDGAIRDSIRSHLPNGTWSAKILRQGLWTPFSKAFRSLKERPDAVVLPLPRCLEGVDSTWIPPAWTVRFGFDRNMRWDMRMSHLPGLPVHAKCKSGPGKTKICRFEGTFESGRHLVSIDTLPSCQEVVADGR
ncbi:MAG TPA: serine protease [Fibrobacteria bacterium]|nr:serine protease [Fibrobacteria bacterium]HOX51875.1 serine protease [Fibrobacteria bacterium]